MYLKVQGSKAKCGESSRTKSWFNPIIDYLLSMCEVVKLIYIPTNILSPTSFCSMNEKKGAYTVLFIMQYKKRELILNYYNLFFGTEISLFSSISYRFIV